MPWSTASLARFVPIFSEKINKPMESSLRAEKAAKALVKACSRQEIHSPKVSSVRVETIHAIVGQCEVGIFICSNMANGATKDATVSAKVSVVQEAWSRTNSGISCKANTVVGSYSKPTTIPAASTVHEIWQGRWPVLNRVSEGHMFQRMALRYPAVVHLGKSDSDSDQLTSRDPYGSCQKALTPKVICPEIHRYRKVLDLHMLCSRNTSGRFNDQGPLISQHDQSAFE